MQLLSHWTPACARLRISDPLPGSLELLISRDSRTSAHRSLPENGSSSKAQHTEDLLEAGCAGEIEGTHVREGSGFALAFQWQCYLASAHLKHR